MVSESLDGGRVLLGEAKWSPRPFDRRTLEPILRELAAKPAPPLPPRLAGAELVRALFVPEAAGREIKGAMRDRHGSPGPVKAK